MRAVRTTLGEDAVAACLLHNSWAKRRAGESPV